MNFIEVKNNIWEHENARARKDAKRLVVMAGMHGDEPAGLAALEYVKKSDLELPEHIRSITLIIGNPEAIKRKVRGVDVDLNRVWNEQENHDTTTIEYKRYLEIRSVLFRPSTVLLDIHTTSAAHDPFVILDHAPDQETRKMIQKLPAQYITWNWREFIGRRTISGGLYAYDPESISLTCEMGQHDAVESEEHAVKTVSAFLDHYIAWEDDEQKIEKQWLKVLQQFVLPEMKWEWEKIEKGPFPIKAGELLGYVDGVAYHSPVDGFLLMPNRKFGPTNPDVGFFAVKQQIT